MWAYDGWADLSNLSGEMRDPERSLPRALILGTVAIVAVYLTANLGYAHSLGQSGLAASTTGVHMAAANVARAALGDRGQVLLAALIFISCAGGAMSSLLTGSRIFVPLATDGLFIRWLGAVAPSTGVPARAVIVSALLGISYVLVRSFEQLTEAFVVGFFPFYMLVVAAVYVLRRREPERPRPFRVPGYPVVPALFLVGAAALLVGAVQGADRTALFALGVVALGIPVRWALGAR
jgi:amino acid transporter